MYTRPHACTLQLRADIAVVDTPNAYMHTRVCTRVYAHACTNCACVQSACIYRKCACAESVHVCTYSYTKRLHKVWHAPDACMCRMRTCTHVHTHGFTNRVHAMKAVTHYMCAYAFTHARTCMRHSRLYTIILNMWTRLMCTRMVVRTLRRKYSCIQ